jgi:hypothetical protein
MLHHPLETSSIVVAGSFVAEDAAAKGASMKAIRISALATGGYQVAPFGLPAIHREGAVNTDHYYRQARGVSPTAKQQSMPADAFRTIVLSSGRFTRFASQPGALLTFVISGELTVDREQAQPLTLEPGDVLLTDEASAANLAFDAVSQCRLLQLGVAKDWPNGAPSLDVQGTIIPRSSNVPNIKRMFTGDDSRSHFAHFPELFSGPKDHWSLPRLIHGFKILCWEDSELDCHPAGVDQLAIFLSGETQLEVGGEGGAIEIFRAGDICLGEDRTGEGHADRVLGAVYTVMLAVDSGNAWQARVSSLATTQ